MELTQRLECTQELNPKCSEKEFPDQIGFLGICGTKYPLKKGPNKIGRDPDTCNIILNLNSISRQHAVINILNNHEFMLMDLDSANKTKLCDKTLQAYIPHPLKNGDMVQFGQVFGVFRLLEEDNDLPMTQALDIPETPVQNRHVSKLNTVHATTIPESPDVSDKEDSFIAPSQPKPRNVFKSPNNNFIKTSGKTISIKPIGTNKIDNVYWSSSKKSDSFSLQSDTSNNDLSIQSDNVSKETNIHELETQVADNRDDSVDSIYNANTQFIINPTSPSIHNMETQVPTDLPEVCKIQEQHDVQINFTTDNKENDTNIFNADTQIEPVKHSTSNKNATDKISNPLSTESTKDKDNVSDEVILFDEVDSQPFEENFESQALLPPEFGVINDNQEVPIEDSQEIRIGKSRTKEVRRLISDSSTDCEDDDINIAMTQKIAELNDDTTDCEDDDATKPSEKEEKKVDIDDDVTDCEDIDENDIILQNKEIDITEMDTQIIEIDTNVEKNEVTKDCSKKEINMKDKPIQVIEQKINLSKEEEAAFEDLATQIIEEDVCFEEALTQKIYSQEIVPAFKVPKASPLKGIKKTDSGLKIINQIINIDVKKPDENNDIDEELYYAATQEIFQDLCSQRELSPEIVKISTKRSSTGKDIKVNEVSVAQNVTKLFDQDSSDDIDIDEKIDNFVYNLSNSQIRDVVGIKKVSSGSSDPELTPKKINPVTILNMKLPTTDEIKKYLNSSKQGNLNVSSESESGTSISSPIKIRNSKNDPPKAKTNLTKKFEVELQPMRVITRVRKPTSKLLNSDETTKILCDSILKSKFLTDKKTGKDVETKADNRHKSKKDKPSKSKTKSEQPDTKNNSKDNKTKKHEDTKLEKRNSEKETRKLKKNKEKDELEQSKQSNTKPNNEKVTKNILYYLENTGRNTRSRSNQRVEVDNDKKAIENKLTPKDKVPEKKSHRSRNKVTEKCEPTPEKEVRRSRRQRSSKKSEETLKSDTKSKAKVSKVSHEQSTVYNTSSDSTMDSANKLKRSATENFEVPSAKKLKSETNSKNLSLRATPARKVKTHYVLFTAFPCEEVKMKLEKLGAVIVSDVMQCTVVLTMQVKRTFKLLCAVGLGKPIVGPTWVQACADTNMIVDPWLHLIKDETTEKRFQFNLERSLATRRNFLKGYNVSSTPSVMPNAQEMKLIVECSGGTWKAGGANWICVSAIPDKALWPALKKKGAIIVSTEFILAGVLKQRVEIDKNKLE